MRLFIFGDLRNNVYNIFFLLEILNNTFSDSTTYIYKLKR